MVCNIELHMGMEELVNLNYLGLNVAESSSIIDIPGGILGKLLSLQYLALCVQITARKEVANLKRLEYIHSRFSYVSDLNAFVGSRGREFLPYYSIAVSKSHELIFFSRDARLIVLAGVDIGREPIEFSSNVERLRIEHVKGGTRSLNDCAGMASLRAATGLRHLKISHCGEMECVFSAWRPQINNLTALLLSGLEKLTALFGFVSCPSTGMLSSLAGIHIYKCHKLRELFSFGCLPPNLEEIDVSCCDQMEKIVTWGEGSIIASGSVNNSDTAQTQLLCFPKLKKLMLWNLPQLRSILAKSGVIMACDALVQIAIWDCPLLRSVPLHLTPDRHLEEIVVRDCAQMKEIVTCVEGSGIASGSINNSDTTQTQLLRLPKLKKLELWDLAQLKSMFPESGIVMVSNVLETIEVIRCPLLRRVPLHLPLLPDGQPSAPPYLQQVKIRPLEWWHSSDWGHPNAKAVLRPFLMSDCAERLWDFRPVELDVLDAPATTSSSGQM